jgi:hypothetical protein
MITYEGTHVMLGEMNSRVAVHFDDAPRFDYNCAPSSAAKFLMGQQADRLRQRCATSILQVGDTLFKAKRHLSHGVFLRWIELEVRIPTRSAQPYMRAGRWASNKGATVAHLLPSAAYLLSASSTPEDFWAGIPGRGDTGAPSIVRQKLRSRGPAGSNGTAKQQDQRSMAMAWD